MATVTDPRNPIKPRNATRPAAGLCRWITKPNARHEGGADCLAQGTLDLRGGHQPLAHGSRRV
jgi:hypothetical protein